MPDLFCSSTFTFRGEYNIKKGVFIGDTFARQILTIIKMEKNKRKAGLTSASRDAWKRSVGQLRLYSTTANGMLLISVANFIILLSNLAITLLGRKKAEKHEGKTGMEKRSSNISLRENPLSYDLATRRKKREEEFMKRANEILARNITNPDYTQTRFCMDLHMDRSGVFRIMKRNTGYAVRAYIMHQRVELAMKLIAEMPDRNDRQIAELTGFLDEKQMQRYYVKETGLLPDEYRRQNNINDMQ